VADMVTPNFFQAARIALGLMSSSSPAATSPGELEAEDTAAGDRWARRPGRDQTQCGLTRTLDSERGE